MSNSGHKHAASLAQNYKAQLASAYNDLGKELSSTKIKVVGNYTLGKVIGEGTYGKVRLGTHRLTSTRVAIKQIPKSLSATLTREIHHHRQLHHPHVTQLYEVIATENSIWLVTELCSGGELFDYITEKGRLSEDETRIIFGQLCLAVNYVHEKGIVHRDLKLENVLLDERCRIKLGDFGFTREFERGAYLETFCGTTGYAAPEMLEGKKYLGPEVDVLVSRRYFVLLVDGALPFDDDNDTVMRDKVIKAEFEDPEWLSEDVRDLLKHVLQKDPTKRMTIRQILAHPWFTLHAPSSANSPPAATAGPVDSRSSYEPSGSSATSESTTYGSTSSEIDRSSNTTPDEEQSQDSHEKPLHVHRNASQSTIKKPEGKAKGKQKGVSQPETVQEEEPSSRSNGVSSSASTSSRPRTRSPSSSSKEPPAMPTRTPVRTKRRSVSSTLSDPASPTTEKPMTPLPPQDFASLMNTPAPIIFGTSLERELLNSLSALGFDTPQIVHSVLSNACDSAGAMWWMLKRKSEKRAMEEGTVKSVLSQIEEHEQATDDAERQGSVEKKRRKNSRATQPPLSSARSAPELAFIPPTPTVSQQRPMTPPRNKSPNNPFLSPSTSAAESLVKSTASTPAGSLKDKDSSKGRREGKARSGSVSIMQRATTALEAAGLVRKKSSEAVKEQHAKDKEQHAKDKEKESEKKVVAAEERRDSHGKLPKSPPLKAVKDTVMPSTPSMDLASAPVNPSSPWMLPNLSNSPPGSHAPTPVNSPGDTLTALPNITENGIKSGHHRNRASLLSAFRMWFNEDRKGKRKAGAGSGHGLSYGHSVNGRSPSSTDLGRSSVKVKRQTSGNNRKTHRAKGHSISSHRSSSVNSRRSSTASMHMVILDSPQYGLDHMVNMSRQRSDPSRRSFGSRTPNSERGDYIPSRPSSVQSFSMKQRHRKSPSVSSAGSMHMVRTASPFHRRAGSGSSTRVIRSPPQLSRSPHVRSNSATSSIHSSRPGSFYEPSESEGTRTSSPFRSHSRRSVDDAPKRGAYGTSTFVAQKRQTAFLPPNAATGYGNSVGRSSWKKSWGLEPPGWQSRTAHLPIEVLAISPAGDGSASIRDVFSGRHSLSIGDEDDWVDEDDDVPAFAGGLGQMPTSASAPSSSPFDQNVVWRSIWYGGAFDAFSSSPGK
ncbi:hypothetical protein EW146_g8267 [Bondarzewia mesenterica]|uniref:Protein kinase domain-containing protein n=1 Tax=Bondarzewia mesenterica TaxID=1095465 RepID=A0A4S4LLA0_9AGAM|nr:hypothetical protein EW146_g8267 [Bondarzewia mesenterica]